MAVVYQLTFRGKFMADIQKMMIEGRLSDILSRVIDYEAELRAKHLNEFLENRKYGR